MRDHFVKNRAGFYREIQDNDHELMSNEPILMSYEPVLDANGKKPNDCGVIDHEIKLPMHAGKNSDISVCWLCKEF